MITNMQPSNSRRTATNWVLLATLVVYLILALFTVREVGLVGEVAIGWSQPDAPTVFVNLDPPITSDGAPPQGAGHDIGPLSAR